MKTTELRLGNLVKYEGKIYQVFSLNPCFVGLCEVGKDKLLFDADVSKLEPVELTEEILANIFGSKVLSGSELLSECYHFIRNSSRTRNKAFC